MNDLASSETSLQYQVESREGGGGEATPLHTAAPHNWLGSDVERESRRQIVRCGNDVFLVRGRLESGLCTVAAANVLSTWGHNSI